MKRVINGKNYNTETALRICDLPCPHQQTDFKWEKTSLYRTQKGAYFIAGKGGPMSRWSRATDGGWSNGSGIKPIEKKEAASIAESAGLDADRMSVFGFEVEDA